MYSDDVPGIVRLLRQARGELIVTVKGCSMEPLIHDATSIRVTCGDNLEHRAGSLVLFVGERAQLVAHRVIAAGKKRAISTYTRR